MSPTRFAVLALIGFFLFVFVGKMIQTLCPSYADSIASLREFTSGFLACSLWTAWERRFAGRARGTHHPLQGR